ncbi:glycosyltransferase [Rhodococcus sp. BP-349]|uniref:glycosyltransferase family 2 protein n=1 Tax=unclassified Rhodococcus (in: high G+C Gram-positive bacteria) TaxID=192944 RepID=UPI001C9B69AD|nr:MULTISPECIES: glycosyltransferase [unclassified Rhodococcus (in: high G+C Gram-positive bacteria)]MBY6538542.1 glycosyltransferase [Rhodococcus sp. BP-363]MBY6542879.1 glycosyltransferase [Rhodococcus sp. BP-369]MBY6562109.1 glycosyltransferase [Rhodococcus sp. BP-370]MBY6576401.1 glycosyltransferase [Rhodococcus sp. BP-364]MBY6585702.1 glycosyltransferase [Rhodococcus sp. BP-358]
MTETADRVTVVMITHDRRDELHRTLKHMTSISDAAPIILVDNASTDGTADMVRELFPEVRLLALSENLGAVARNRAVDLVTTPYVAFCDDDTRWQEGALTLGAVRLDAYPALATVTGRCLVAPSLVEDPITPEFRESPIVGPAWLPGPALLGIMAGLTMIRVAAFRRVGGFCEKMWLGGEEELLALDLAAAGWWMVWEEGMVIEHEPSVSRDSTRRRQLGIRNTLWTLWLRRPVRSALRRTVAVVRSAPRDRTTASAVWEAMRSAGWVARERTVVPPSVERGLVLLEEPQSRSVARRYVG